MVPLLLRPTGRRILLSAVVAFSVRVSFAGLTIGWDREAVFRVIAD